MADPIPAMLHGGFDETAAMFDDPSAALDAFEGGLERQSRVAHPNFFNGIF